MNHITVSGNLVDKLRTSANTNGGVSAFGKIGVYNGKTRDGEDREAMFFDIVLFGKTAERLIEVADKGTPVVVSGRLEEDKTIGNNGQTYINKRIVCDDAFLGVRTAQKQPEVEVKYAGTAQVADPFGM